MLKLTDIFKILLLGVTLLTTKVIFAQSAIDKNLPKVSQQALSSHTQNYHFDNVALFFELNDNSENAHVSDTNHFVNNTHSCYFNSVVIKENLAEIFSVKVPISSYKSTHLFIFFHCWKFLFC